MRAAKTFIACIIFLGTLAMAQSIATIEQPLVPTAVQPGGASFTLTINGAGFVPTPTGILFGNTQLPIASSSATQLTATVPMANIAAAGTVPVSVLSTNGFVSNVEFFQISAPTSVQLTPPADYSVGPVLTVLAVDLNGDGILDLAVGVSTPAAGPQVSVLLGNSDGTFKAPTSYPVADASSIVPGLFNSDGGSIDLIAGDTRLVNNGTGVFTVTSLPTKGFKPFAVGDFSHNGVLNIAGLLGPNVQILNNDGGGSFSVGQNFNGGLTLPGAMLAADFDGDGFLDLAVLDSAQMIRVFLGSAANGFSPNPVVTSTPQGVVAFTAADFNNDHIQDIALVYNPATGSQVLILNGKGDGSFTSAFTTPLANSVTGTIVTGDFNEDGKLDLATGTYILQGNGDGTFQTPINFGGTAEVVAAGDFNGDGRPDLVAQASPNIAVLLQGAAGAMLSPSPLNFTPNQPQLVGTGATLPVTLTNTGSATLIIASIGFTGPDAGEFTQDNTCGSLLAPDSSCTINVTFTATANGGSGSATASLSVTDNATGSPQTVPIMGTVRNFSLTTTCTSLTVVPGQTAIYTVDLAPVNGFNQLVSLSCSGAPALATCTVSPASMTLDGSTTIKALVTATTMHATGSLRPPFGTANGNRMAGLVGFAGIAGFAALVVLPRNRRGRLGRRLCGLIFLLCSLASVATLPSCGGGGGGVDPPGTAAGTYPLTVTGTFQSPSETTITESVSFNLVVQ